MAQVTVNCMGRCKGGTHVDVFESDMGTKYQLTCVRCGFLKSVFTRSLADAFAGDHERMEPSVWTSVSWLP